MMNEAMAKVVCNNITCVISTAYELNVAPMIGLDGCTYTQKDAPKVTACETVAGV